MYDTVEAVFAHVEEIRGMGLAVPQISRIFIELARDGYPVPSNVYTVEAAKQILLETLRKGGSAHA